MKITISGNKRQTIRTYKHLAKEHPIISKRISLTLVKRLGKKLK